MRARLTLALLLCVYALALCALVYTHDHATYPHPCDVPSVVRDPALVFWPDAQLDPTQVRVAS